MIVNPCAIGDGVLPSAERQCAPVSWMASGAVVTTQTHSCMNAKASGISYVNEPAKALLCVTAPT